MHFRAQLDSKAVESTGYGRLFIDLANPETTGLSFQGLTVFMMMGALDEALGIASQEDGIFPDSETGEAYTVGAFVEFRVRTRRNSGFLKEERDDQNH